MNLVSIIVHPPPPGECTACGEHKELVGDRICAYCAENGWTLKQSKCAEWWDAHTLPQVVKRYEKNHTNYHMRMHHWRKWLTHLRRKNQISDHQFSTWERPASCISIPRKTSRKAMKGLPTAYRSDMTDALRYSAEGAPHGFGREEDG